MKFINNSTVPQLVNNNLLVVLIIEIGALITTYLLLSYFDPNLKHRKAWIISLIVELGSFGVSVPFLIHYLGTG